MSSNSDWLDFLSANGATIEAGTVTGPNHSSQDKPTITLCALTELTRFNITGPDARKFLQGQVTCDIEKLSPASVTLGAQCNPKGRAIFNFLAISPTEDQVQLRLPQQMQAIAQQSLTKYMVFSKAELEQPLEPIIGLMGDNAEALVRQVFNDCPIDLGSCLVSSKGRIIKHSNQQFECWLDTSSCQETWVELASNAQFSPSQAWFNAEILAGRAMILPATSEEFVPQNINMVETGGVSFTKGCYTGQEVVARMHYLGKQKRHMRLASVEHHAAELTEGAPVYQQDKTQAAGKIVNLVHTSAEGTLLLVDISDAAFDSDSVYLNNPATNEQKLAFKPLPYAFATEPNR